MSRKRQPVTDVSSENSRPGAKPLLGPPVLALALLAGWLAFLGFFVLAHPVRPLVAGQLFQPLLLIAQWFGDAEATVALLDRAPVVAAAAAWLLAAYGYGAAGLRLVGQRSLLPREEVALATGAGLNLLSTLVLLTGLLAGGTFGYSAAAWLIVVFGLALAWRFRPLRRADGPAVVSAQPPWPSPLELLLRWELVVVGVLSAPYFLGGVLPPWDFDVREYHLQAPREWFENRQIDFLPHNIYANMPLGVELHALAGAWLLQGLPDGLYQGLWAGKLIVACHAPLTALLLLGAGERFLPRGAGLAAAAMFLLHPWTGHIALGGLNDGAYGFYALAAGYLCLLGNGRAAAVSSAWFAGAAAACKYPGAVFVAAPLALVWLGRGIFRRSNSPAAPARTALTAALWFVLAASLGGGVWYAKNALLTGNPVYPLAGRWLGGESRTPEQIAQWDQAHAVPRDAGGRSYSAAQLADAIARFAWKRDYAGPLLAPLAAVTAAVWLGREVQRRRTASGLLPASASSEPSTQRHMQESGLAQHLALGAALAAALWLAGGWWLWTHRIDRFLAPVFPLAAFLAGACVTLRSDPPWRYALSVILTLGLLYGLLDLVSPHVADNRWFVAPAELGERPPAVTGIAERLNQETAAARAQGATPAVLLVGEAQALDYRSRVYYNTCFDACLLVEWLAELDAPARRRLLRERGVRWVAVDWNELRRYRSPGNYGYDPRFSPALVDELAGQGVLVLEEDWGEPRPFPGSQQTRPSGSLYRVGGMGDGGDSAEPAAGAAASPR